MPAFLLLCPREGSTYTSAEQEGQELGRESTAGPWREALPYEGCCPLNRERAQTVTKMLTPVSLKGGGWWVWDVRLQL